MTKRIPVYMSDRIKDKVGIEASRRGLSISSYINKLIGEDLNEEPSGDRANSR